MRPFPIAFLLTALGLFTGCGGEMRALAPPDVSVQTLVLGRDASLGTQLRIQNFGPKPVHFDYLQTRLELAGIDAGELRVPLALEIPGHAAEVVPAVFKLSTASRAAIETALRDTSRAVPYRLVGTVVTDKPQDTHPLEHVSSLSPVPGKPGEYR